MFRLHSLLRAAKGRNVYKIIHFSSGGTVGEDSINLISLEKKKFQLKIITELGGPGIFRTKRIIVT